jgi:hypothetical protein
VARPTRRAINEQKQNSLADPGLRIGPGTERREYLSGTIEVVKASGERTLFSESKFRQSLQRSGAGEAAIDNVTAKIMDQLYDGIPTRKIYRNAYRQLRRESLTSAARYNLKQAIMDFGPSGYPFEIFVGRLIESMGYSVQIALRMEGKCVGHEVDVLAEKTGNRILLECKFHNRPGVKSDVKVCLYFQSRFLDLKSHYNHNGDHSIHEGWIATNTKFTTDAIRYAGCMDLNLMGWDHPRGYSLVERVENARIYPLTILHSLTKKEKTELIVQKLVLVSEIADNPGVLYSAKLSDSRIRKVIAECRDILHE